MERDCGREIFVPAALSALAISLLVVASTAGFSDAVKAVAYERQHGLCSVCGKPLKKGEGHHCVPKSKGGSNTNPDNCTMCHGSGDRTDCHEKLDRLALDKGIILDTHTNELIPIAQAALGLFTSERVREKTVQQFSLGEQIVGTINMVRKLHHKDRRNSHRHGNHGRR